MKVFKLLILLILVSLSCFTQNNRVIVGAESTNEFFPILKNKRVAIMSNHTGMVGKEHLVDILVKNKINMVCILSPEHGFRGNADAGEHVSSSVDEKTGIPIRSLYDGKDQKPSSDTMDSFDVLIIDIQDVGLRFYTYYITMARLMDACAEYNKKMIVLDRPNPNGHYIDGPILDMKHKSGVGWLPIPVVHGMTLGELALMINGEKWLPQSRVCDVTVIKCKNYTHQTLYQLPVPPSPNLPNMKSIYLYPSTCLFEATPVSLGRGTEFPFQVYGHPNMKGYSFSFTPQSIPGAKNPPQLNRECFGVDLRNIPDEEIFKKGFDLSYIIDAYKNLNLDDHFFRPFFEKLVGVSYIRKMIMEGRSADEIKEMWKDDVEKFREQRKPYLLYAE
ncbi:exo-beta-N-acetylmuramidase NamZ family protein [Dysgonomonas termitidis]|uniref:Exo-beta-N-acetylmuramidase NamZ domain-containing protein n=1 Tax=Dysgonomonas termitidis TaxID=1516126 RepID=A0ABV9KQW6_9BACT